MTQTPMSTTVYHRDGVMQFYTSDIVDVLREALLDVAASESETSPRALANAALTIADDMIEKADGPSIGAPQRNDSADLASAINDSFDEIRAQLGLLDKRLVDSGASFPNPDLRLSFGASGKVMLFWHGVSVSYVRAGTFAEAMQLACDECDRADQKKRGNPEKISATLNIINGLEPADRAAVLAAIAGGQS
jgi:hypothetical protein